WGSRVRPEARSAARLHSGGRVRAGCANPENAHSSERTDRYASWPGDTRRDVLFLRSSHHIEDRPIRGRESASFCYLLKASGAFQIASHFQYSAPPTVYGIVLEK